MKLPQWSQAELTLIAVMPLPLSVIGPEGGVYDPELEREEKGPLPGDPGTPACASWPMPAWWRAAK
jgi:hypothetical protein